ncbi:hypothetical protein FGO68_gene1237 [Halteria grandinella]|uniref:Uncharacterized protein n=1 Tax=Halteria grandinella TaxID=5974 RepID=A0A8J8P0E4_HALGN|nr:hypothetical protein FGO68_gene1237 [Halteria grandinella]
MKESFLVVCIFQFRLIPNNQNQDLALLKEILLTNGEQHFYFELKQASVHLLDLKSNTDAPYLTLLAYLLTIIFFPLFQIYL